MKDEEEDEFESFDDDYENDKEKKKLVNKEPGNGGVKNFFLKVFVDFEGHLYDYFELKSIEHAEEYNEKKGELEYLIVFNRVASIRANVSYITFRYPTKKERDTALRSLKEKLVTISMKIGGENFNE